MYAALASEESLEKTVGALKEKGIEVYVVDTQNQALEKIKELIPQGASVMNGSSKTLTEIGYEDYLASGKHRWKDLHKAINTENDKVKRNQLRQQAVLSDYYVGSVHALSQTGEFLIASNTGSQLPHIAFTSQNLIFVVGTQKIVPNLVEALNRLETYVVPLENEHMKQKYGLGTTLNKILIFKGESPMIGRKVRIILVNKILGF